MKDAVSLAQHHSADTLGSARVSPALMLATLLVSTPTDATLRLTN